MAELFGFRITRANQSKGSDGFTAPSTDDGTWLSVVVIASFGDDEALLARRGEYDVIKMMVFLRWRQSALSSSSLHAWQSPHARVSLLVKNQAARRRLEHRRAVGARRNRDKVVHERVGNVLTPVRGRTFVGHRSCVCGKQKICDVSARSRRRTRGRKRARDEAKSLHKFTQTNDTYLGGSSRAQQSLPSDRS